MFVFRYILLYHDLRLDLLIGLSFSDSAWVVVAQVFLFSCFCLHLYPVFCHVVLLNNAKKRSIMLPKHETAAWTDTSEPLLSAQETESVDI